MKPIETARLRLREMSAERDASFVLEALNEPAFVRNVGDRGVRTETDAAEYIRARITAEYQRRVFGMWLVELRETAEAVGMCGLLKRDTLEDVDIGFTFLERFWSKGYAFEAASAVMAFGWTVAKLPRIIAITAPTNESSIRLLGKLGLRFSERCRVTPDAPEVNLFKIERPT
ncbi:MAG: GNAT family N-acetyltransferase [Verrucomicrobiota bacterium]|nr:GNAT family N-acetyltransferase [Verrucomicrobiota bacterium]